MRATAGALLGDLQRVELGEHLLGQRLIAGRDRVERGQLVKLRVHDRRRHLADHVERVPDQLQRLVEPALHGVEGFRAAAVRAWAFPIRHAGHLVDGIAVRGLVLLQLLDRRRVRQRDRRGAVVSVRQLDDLPGRLCRLDRHHLADRPAQDANVPQASEHPRVAQDAVDSFVLLALHVADRRHELVRPLDAHRHRVDPVVPDGQRQHRVDLGGAVRHRRGGQQQHAVLARRQAADVGGLGLGITALRGCRRHRQELCAFEVSQGDRIFKAMRLVHHQAVDPQLLQIRRGP